MKKKDKFSPERKIDLNELYPEEWAPQLYNKLKVENPKYYYKIYSKDEFGRTYDAMFYGCGVHIYRQLVTKREESGLYVPAITLKELNKWYNDRYKVTLDFEKFRYWDLLNLFYRMTLTLEKVNNNKIVTKVIKDYNKMWNTTLNAKDYFIKEKKK